MQLPDCKSDVGLNSRTMLKKSLILLVLSMSLAACVSQQPLNQISNWNSYQRQLGAIDEWQIRGKLTIKMPGDAIRPRIHWQQKSHEYAIRLWLALGQGTTWLYGNDQEVRLERAGSETLYARSAEQLLSENLGYEIPVEDLRYWVRGIPAPYAPVQASQLSAEGTLESLEQSGWSLEYERYQRQGQWNLPSHIVAVRDEGEIEITLRVSKWDVPE